MATIHPTAQVDPRAKLAADVEIGPRALIEGPIELAEGCRVDGLAILRGRVVAGPGCRFGSHCLVGGDPQDRGFDPTIESGVRLGANNTIRELVTIHRGSQPGSWTELGDDNFLMGGVHLGHDVQIGSGNNVANNVLFAGHVQIGDRCFIGGGAVVHQFVRIGDLALMQGISGLSLDLPPYSVVAGVNGLAGLNTVGLRRAGLGADERAELRRVWKAFFAEGRSLEELLQEYAGADLGPASRTLVDFCAAPSRKGLLRRAATR